MKDLIIIKDQAFNTIRAYTTIRIGCNEKKIEGIHESGICDVGIYETRSRTKEVFEEIFKVIVNSKCVMVTDGFGSFKGSTPETTPVYRMPIE